MTKINQEWHSKNYYYLISSVLYKIVISTLITLSVASRKRSKIKIPLANLLHCLTLLLLPVIFSLFATVGLPAQRLKASVCHFGLGLLFESSISILLYIESMVSMCSRAELDKWGTNERDTCRVINTSSRLNFSVRQQELYSHLTIYSSECQTTAM